MKILFEKKFLKDIEGVNDKRIKQQVEAIISEMEKAQHPGDLHNLKKMKGHKSAYSIIKISSFQAVNKLINILLHSINFMRNFVY